MEFPDFANLICDTHFLHEGGVPLYILIFLVTLPMSVFIGGLWGGLGSDTSVLTSILHSLEGTQHILFLIFMSLFFF